MKPDIRLQICLMTILMTGILLGILGSVSSEQRHYNDRLFPNQVIIENNILDNTLITAKEPRILIVGALGYISYEHRLLLNQIIEENEILENTLIIAKEQWDIFTKGIMTSSENSLYKELSNNPKEKLKSETKILESTKKIKENLYIGFNNNIEGTGKLGTKFLAKAKKYRPLVQKSALETKVDPALIYSVIHNESTYNARAKSKASAYGLMQVVPSTAVKEVAIKFHPKGHSFTTDELYEPKTNITIGSSYLSLLYHSYFKKVENNTSRLYLTIAAYNTGIGNVARGINGEGRNLKKAVYKVNTMTPEEVYSTLQKGLPHSETKTYLKKVTQKYAVYKKALDTGRL